MVKAFVFDTFSVGSIPTTPFLIEISHSIIGNAVNCKFT